MDRSGPAELCVAKFEMRLLFAGTAMELWWRSTILTTSLPAAAAPSRTSGRWTGTVCCSSSKNRLRYGDFAKLLQQKQSCSIAKLWPLCLRTKIFLPCRYFPEAGHICWFKVFDVDEGWTENTEHVLTLTLKCLLDKSSHCHWWKPSVPATCLLIALPPVLQSAGPGCLRGGVSGDPQE